jgi:putative hydrolase of the HAD superfamily
LDYSIHAVIFDMDDTLYDEMTFVQSGFRAVAQNLSTRFNLDSTTVYQEMLDHLKNDGRGKIFDTVLENHDIHDPQLIEEMINIYRLHTPEISLFPDSVNVLENLRTRKLKLGIITDGLHTVQKKKVGALKLQELVDFIIYTDELGHNCEKPHPIAFLCTIKMLHLEPRQIMYIGNDPTKDISGGNSVGMVTVHLSRDNHICNGSCNATFHATSLKNIFDITTVKFVGGVTCKDSA